MKKPMTIVKLTKPSGISTVIIRYYARRGLVQRVFHIDGDCWLYDVSIILCLHFIKNAKLAEFSLEKIRKLLALQQDKQQSNRGLNDC